METKDRKTFLIAAVVVCLAFWLGDSLIVEPLISSWKARDARLVALRLQVAKGDQLLKRKAYYENRWRQMKANTLPLNISQAESQMITAFDRWQRESGVKLERIAPQWKNDEEFTALEYRADVTGSLDSLTKFLYSVEKGPPALKLDNMDITTRDNSGQQFSLGLQWSGLILGTLSTP